MTGPDPTPQWRHIEPGRLIGRGHPAGDFLEAYDWNVLERGQGYLKLDVHLPPQARNPRGQLFGGFTPTYVDMVALHTVRAGREMKGPWRWSATSSMRIDYFEPVWGPRFLIESRLIKSRSRTHFVDTRFFDSEGDLLVFAVTTLKELQVDRPHEGGDGPGSG